MLDMLVGGRMYFRSFYISPFDVLKTLMKYSSSVSESSPPFLTSIENASPFSHTSHII